MSHVPRDVHALCPAPAWGRHRVASGVNPWNTAPRSRAPARGRHCRSRSRVGRIRPGAFSQGRWRLCRRRAYERGCYGTGARFLSPPLRGLMTWGCLFSTGLRPRLRCFIPWRGLSRSRVRRRMWRDPSIIRDGQVPRKTPCPWGCVFGRRRRRAQGKLRKVLGSFGLHPGG